MYNILKTKKILFVEDDTVARYNIKEILEEFFCKVIDTGSGEEAWQKFISEQPDVLITDIELPGTSGLELIRNIREIRTDIPIIIVSQHTKNNYFLEAIEFKIDEFIIKPFTAIKLHNIIMKLEEYFS